MTDTNLAKFTISGTPSSQGGYSVAPGETPVLQLEASSQFVARVTFKVKGTNNSVRASVGAPELTLSNGVTTGQEIDATTQSGSVTISSGIPATRAPHLWEVVCEVDAGRDELGNVDPNRTFSRFVAMLGEGDQRKILADERGEYDPDGSWAEAHNALVDLMHNIVLAYPTSIEFVASDFFYVDVPETIEATIVGAATKVVFRRGATTIAEVTSAPWRCEWTPSATGAQTITADVYLGSSLMDSVSEEVDVGTWSEALAAIGFTGTGAAIWIAGDHDTLDGTDVVTSTSVIADGGSTPAYEIAWEAGARPTYDDHGMVYDPVTATGKLPAWVFDGAQYGECTHADIATTYGGGTAKPYAFFVVATFSGSTAATFAGTSGTAVTDSFRIGRGTTTSGFTSGYIAYYYGSTNRPTHPMSGQMVTGIERTAGGTVSSYWEGRQHASTVGTQSTALTGLDRVVVGCRKNGGAYDQYLTGRIAVVGIAPACTDWARLQQCLRGKGYVVTVDGNASLFYYTADPHGGNDATRPAALGTIVRQLINQSLRAGDPEAVICAGDLSQGGTLARFQELFGAYSTICDPTWTSETLPPLVHCLGNHDAYYSGSAEADVNYATYADQVFTGAAAIREAGWYYTKVVAGVRFYALNVQTFDATQNDWLADELDANDERWQIVLEHRPPDKFNSYTETYYPLEDLLPMIKTANDSGKVRVMMHGHQHVCAASFQLDTNGAHSAQGIFHLCAPCHGGVDIGTAPPSDGDYVVTDGSITRTFTVPDDLDFSFEPNSIYTGGFVLVRGSASDSLTFEWYVMVGTNAIGYVPQLLRSRTYAPPA